MHSRHLPSRLLRLWSVTGLLLAVGCGDGGKPRPPADPEGDADTAASALAPLIDQLADQVVNEEETLLVAVDIQSSDASMRVSALGVPPGAHWDPVNHTLTFRPDFTQGGRTHTLTILADNAYGSTTVTFDIVVNDTVTPPEPIASQTVADGIVTYDLVQGTDAFLAGPHLAGTEYPAIVAAPVAALDAGNPHSFPVLVQLHGYMTPLEGYAWEREVRIFPYDPLWSSFYGYSDSIPDAPAASSDVGPYTERRIIHLLDWVLRNVPGADPERVYVRGSSMGGAGTGALAIFQQRHFAYGEMHTGGTIPRHNWREWRRESIEALWGPFAVPLDAGPNRSAWDHLDLTRALRDEPNARNQFLFAEHSKGDEVVHFGAAVIPSPLTCLRFYDAAQDFHLGHYFVWREGLHNADDPTLGWRWWKSGGFNPIHFGPSLLRRDRAFVAFSGSSCNQDPGDGTGDGTTELDLDRGYATIDGRSGWTGDDVGALNRFLEWDGEAIADELYAFSVPLRVLSGEGEPAPVAGYPSIGDLLDCALPVYADVTPRRTQRFQATPGEVVHWRFGTETGTVVANSDGSVTIPQLPLGTEWADLVLERQAVPEITTPTPLGDADACVQAR